MKELNAKYNHLEVETNKYNHWVEKGYFTAGDKSKEPFTIVIPPPNVTGKLHLGHAWDNTLQDIISRYKRMQGFDMLYLPGMDHAGIATQAKVDARLKDEGISRYDLGREKFLDRAWEWKEEYAEHIRNQWSKLGNSVDYSRERFTLDEGLNKAVTKVFCDLYNEGLIYQGERIINWDPKAKTALSNIEVIHKEVEGAFYTFNYSVKETGETFQVATTRPETMFGDVCVVVHPEDEKYKHLIGKHAINPANHEEIIIIADDYIEIGFGTGAMKCTPAHDPNDFQIAERHNLPKIVCMNPDGTMNELAGEYNGMDRFECRKALTERIKQEGNLVSIEKHIHQVGHSERTDVIVEPYLSKQWFVKMKPLANDVLTAQNNPEQKINFYPNRFENIFNQWLENIEDWCISRQLWWGHRIPAWYHNETGEIYVGIEAPSDIENWTQDEDVLDTWFSSALWPFSTLGWPNETDDLKRYYPTNCMVTGYDIIFFWVARMAFQARHFTDCYPFKDCLIHGLIRDEQGRKMSKSLGNGIDPMDVIDEYGVDSLRFFLTTNSTPGQDMRYIPSKVEASWNFINKIWNASRFVMMNLPEDFDTSTCIIENASMTDQWIINRFNEILEHTNTNMDKYEFAIVGNELYNFVWDDFCSWYIEFSKSGLNSEDERIKNATRSTLVLMLDGIIKMLHPFMPFVTEEIYQALHNTEASICVANWPKTITSVDTSSSKQVDQLIEIITIIRQIKTDNNLKPSTPLRMMIQNLDATHKTYDKEVASILEKMCKVTWVDSIDDELMIRPIEGGSISLPMSEVINLEEEIEKLNKEKETLEKEINRGEKMLSNESFISKASPNKVEEEKNKLENYKNQYEIVSNRLKELTSK
ncbi:valine--tRNA ligase [Anaerorhabdus furcosa]|uniref:Valine--tRNA ligase n=1 Tax=Anaerorhabdus furcosa TaxID=118967 RepID=A0A1T4PJ85_9FIRM|nr:valine--tRNA ligase [Anaerorhabdus furcosa]SJZ91347.1 valyl-tRNA synthetase [Anaerorhabdus furcosa]